MDNSLFEKTIVNAFPELVPSIHIAPLDISSMEQATFVPDVFDAFETNKHVSMHKKARYAITSALKDLHLLKDDVVTILTTSGNFYVSGCVTKAIENVCKWNREICLDSKAILVIHEFGYPYKGLSELKKYGLPIIEDCAYSYFTDDNEMGQVGDYVIYSFPKAFNMQIGSAMLSNTILSDETTPAEKEYILSYLYCGLDEVRAIVENRLFNYHYLCNALAPLEIAPFFELDKGVVPGVFLFKWRDDIDYPDLKEFMQKNGVESSVFYGKNAFFIPVHQNIFRKELDYMIILLRYYYETKVRQ